MVKKIRHLGVLPGLTRKTPKSGSNLKKKFHSGKKEDNPRILSVF
jgi:hypothetical protein